MIIKPKDTMWYVKSLIEAIQIFIFLVCLIGFIVTFIVMFFCQDTWVSNIMSWSVCVGLVNVLFLVSGDNDWRDYYRDKKDAEKFD